MPKTGVAQYRTEVTVMHVAEVEMCGRRFVARGNTRARAAAELGRAIQTWKHWPERKRERARRNG